MTIAPFECSVTPCSEKSREVSMSMTGVAVASSIAVRIGTREGTRTGAGIRDEGANRRAQREMSVVSKE